MRISDWSSDVCSSDLLNSPKLAEMMQTDPFIYHGYVQLWLGGVMRKVTPAFNMELCERFGVKPLVFDGPSDALFHEFDANNQRHLEFEIGSVCGRERRVS